MGAAAIVWHLGPFEPWAGLSSTALLAPRDGAVAPASLVQGELGLGLGGAHFGAGVYGGVGWPGPVAGLYARAMFGGPSWINLGLEPRVFYLSDSGATGVSLMARVELGRNDRRVRRDDRDDDRDDRDDDDRDDDRDVPASAPAEGDGADALPVGASPPPEPAPEPPPEDDRHHDDPY
jgi:hypothetical protein